MQASCLANGTKKQTDWKTVNWHKANQVVRNLRYRIFRATQERDLKKVRSLQKLMLKSHSNRLVSVRRVTQINAGKNTPGVDKLVIKTPAARGNMVDELAQYTPRKAKPVRRVYIPKTNHKLRPLGIPVVVDRDAFKPSSKTPLSHLGRPGLRGRAMAFGLVGVARMPLGRSMHSLDPTKTRNGYWMPTSKGHLTPSHTTIF
jgi:hypothetical protein